MSLCDDCGHEHAGKDMAFICIGCPCEARPGQKEPAQKPTTSRQDYETPRDFLDAVEERFGPLTADLACTAENKKATEARRADAPACSKLDDEQAMADAIAIAYPRADHREPDSR